MKRGAFTGAHARQEGAMQAANHGTLFLDEIGDLTLVAQAKSSGLLKIKKFVRSVEGRATP